MSFNVQIDASDWRRLQRAFERAPELTNKYMNLALDTALKGTQSQVQKNLPVTIGGVSRGVNLGLLRRGITQKVESLMPRPKGRVFVAGPASKYAPFVEFGRSPGRPPPIDAILHWVVRKRIQPAGQVGRRGRGRGRVRGFMLGTSAQVQIAFLIARAIGARGTQALRFFERALPHAREIAKIEFRKAVSNLRRAMFQGT